MSLADLLMDSVAEYSDPPTRRRPVGLRIGAVTRTLDPAREPDESPRAVQMVDGRVVRELGDDGVWRDV